MCNIFKKGACKRRATKWRSWKAVRWFGQVTFRRRHHNVNWIATAETDSFGIDEECNKILIKQNPKPSNQFIFVLNQPSSNMTILYLYNQYSQAVWALRLGKIYADIVYFVWTLVQSETTVGLSVRKTKVLPLSKESGYIKWNKLAMCCVYSELLYLFTTVLIPVPNFITFQRVTGTFYHQIPVNLRVSRNKEMLTLFHLSVSQIYPCRSQNRTAWLPCVIFSG